MSIRRTNLLNNALLILDLNLSLARFDLSSCGSARVAVLKASVYTACLESILSGTRV